MRGNSAILKCNIPSFVADFVYVVAWIDSEGQEFLPPKDMNSSGGKHAVNFLRFPSILIPFNN